MVWLRQEQMYGVSLAGNGFYEQRAVREQIAQLTGRRFPPGLSSDQAQFQALMEQGAAHTHPGTNPAFRQRYCLASQTIGSADGWPSAGHAFGYPSVEG